MNSPTCFYFKTTYALRLINIVFNAKLVCRKERKEEKDGIIHVSKDMDNLKTLCPGYHKKSSKFKLGVQK